MDHYESKFFSLFINDEIIMGGGSNWAELPIMGEAEVLSYESSLMHFVRDNWVVTYTMNGYDGVSKWGFKDPRICVLIPLYLKIFPNMKMIFIKRNKEDVCKSLMNRKKKGIKKRRTKNHWGNLYDAYNRRIERYLPQITDVHSLTYEGLCVNTNQEVNKIIDFVEGQWNRELEQVCARVHSQSINKSPEEGWLDWTRAKLGVFDK